MNVTGTYAITVTPRSGYKLAALMVKDASGKALAVTTDNNGKYYVTMPDGNVTVKTSFTSTSTADTTNPKTGDAFPPGAVERCNAHEQSLPGLLLAETRKRRFAEQVTGRRHSGGLFG